MSAGFQPMPIWLQPAGRDRWTSPDGETYVVVGVPSGPHRFRVSCGLERFGCGSLGAALDAIRVHIASGGKTWVRS